MIFRFDDIVVEPATFRLLRNGEPARIEPKALEVLIRLIERRDRVVTKQELLSDVWRGTVVTENALTRTIAQIRKVLGDDLQSPRYIQTIPTKGYRFIGEVRSETGQATASPAPVTPQPPLTLTAPRSSGMAWSFGVFAVIIVATALVGFVLLASAMKRTGLRIFGPAGKMTIDRDGAAARSPIAGRPLRPSDEVQSFPTFSPDGMSLAYAVDVGGSSHIFISRIGGAGEPHQLTTGDGETQPAWSPDGASIAYVAERRGGIFVVPVEGGEPRRVTTFGSRPQWSPDGRDIAFQSSETMEFGWTANDAHPPSTINIVNVSTRTVTAVTHPGQPAGGHGAPSWRRDGNRLAFSS
ncbi:MAG TPA: winged helix-turn-helix domain-containing protein, partial [Thermoanaerobaculia bacterium]